MKLIHRLLLPLIAVVAVLFASAAIAASADMPPDHGYSIASDLTFDAPAIANADTLPAGNDVQRHSPERTCASVTYDATMLKTIASFATSPSGGAADGIAGYGPGEGNDPDDPGNDMRSPHA